MLFPDMFDPLTTSSRMSLAAKVVSNAGRPAGDERYLAPSNSGPSDGEFGPRIFRMFGRVTCDGTQRLRSHPQPESNPRSGGPIARATARPQTHVRMPQQYQRDRGKCLVAAPIVILHEPPQRAICRERHPSVSRLAGDRAATGVELFPFEPSNTSASKRRSLAGSSTPAKICVSFGPNLHQQRNLQQHTQQERA